MRERRYRVHSTGSLVELISLPRRVLRELAPWLAPLMILSMLITAPEAGASESLAPAKAEPRASVVSPAIGERLLLANRYLEANRLEDALATVDEMAQARKQTPADVAQIHRFRGYILLAKSDNAGAIKELEAALDTEALDEAAQQGLMYSLAQLYTQAGQIDRARQLIDRWFQTAADPKPDAFFLKAMILVQQEDHAAALEPARIAVARSTQDKEGWLQLLAAIEFQLQDYKALADTLRRLVAVAPGTKRYWVQLATIENNIGREDEALASMAIAHESGLLDEDREIRQRARMCFVREIPDCCVETLEQGFASGRVKVDAEAYRLLANCLIAGREIERALDPLAKAGDLGDGARSYLLLGQLQLQRESYDDARGALEKALVSATPTDRPSVELLLGIAHLGSKRFDEAERAFRVAQASEKTRPAAESYMRHLEQQRALVRMRDTSTAASAANLDDSEAFAAPAAQPSM